MVDYNRSANIVKGLHDQIASLKNQLSQERNKNQNYINQTTFLNNQLNQERNKNQNYINQINTLNNQLNQEKTKNQQNQEKLLNEKLSTELNEKNLLISSMDIKINQTLKNLGIDFSENESPDIKLEKITGYMIL
ncbi:7955_t:CDS:1 [Scutellospora calospora]|uniref:7955_t:CDS:1 n=1 Tax=Scutellospora calospora TaxID=85575 RepID=A0ACA9KM48_9GLOM|nr:7955_t:CDS:1 [Scutellospora calospora]